MLPAPPSDTHLLSTKPGPSPKAERPAAQSLYCEDLGHEAPLSDCRRKQSPGRPSTQHAWVVLMVSRAPCHPPRPRVSWTILPSGGKQAPGPPVQSLGLIPGGAPTSHLPPQPPRAQVVGKPHWDRREVLMDASPQRGWEPLAGRTKGASPVTAAPGTKPVLRQESVSETRAPRDVCSPSSSSGGLWRV